MCTVSYMAEKRIDQERVRRMAAAGYGVREISRELGTAHSNVARILSVSEPLALAPVSISARADGTVTLHTDGDPVVLGAAVRRALKRAGIPIEA